MQEGDSNGQWFPQFDKFNLPRDRIQGNISLFYRNVNMRHPINDYSNYTLHIYDRGRVGKCILARFFWPTKIGPQK